MNWRVVCVSLFLASCGPLHEAGPPLFPDRSHYKTEELGYKTVRNRIFRPYCIGCHGNGGDVNLESYENVRKNLAGIRKAVFAKRNMPKAPMGSLSSYNLGLLNAWLELSAPETASEEEVDPPSLAPTFDSIRTHILVPKCLMCHAPGKPTGKVPLVTREDLLNSPLDLVTPGDPEESGLLLALLRQDAKRMPPLNETGGKRTGMVPLSSVELEAIRTWIANGATD